MPAPSPGPDHHDQHDDGALHVLSVGPTGGQPGGMASVVAELETQNGLDAAPVRLRVVDSGGIGPAPRRAANFARALATAGTARADVAHLHVASRGSTWRKMALARVCALRGLPYGIHLHGAGYRDFLRATSPALRRRIERFYDRAAYVVVLGGPWARVVTEELGVPAERVHVVHNGVADGAPPVTPWPADRPRRVVLLGRIDEGKGVPELLRAFERLDDLPDVELVLAGPPADPRVVALVEEAARARPGRVSYAGSLRRAEAQELLRTAYLLALPSHAEGLPMVVIEAMSRGIPAVTTPVGAMEELVTHGANGFLVPPGDVDALTEHLARLLGDPALRDEMARAAYATWAEGFDARTMYAAIRACWRRAAGAQ
ncbi:glycosyltransferase family 4 protein [Blastococcus sp. MG754426]|uniref:glycosyltransferase family 4 protein n=1 Tax=unclassified Blastococcus TaxID=2619396 RepID=UPI001EEFF9B5|nr:MULTISPECIES: glycosyltransferase family 4 protein [unclassified Blastococcus]MCF6508470.1 glycosyltransferase family 4 protein [Blastococcus sp. MG754426]MCF6513471.1 glycosyltransferase family 4 protein [Blastococcus sp. MG754427]